LSKFFSFDGEAIAQDPTGSSFGLVAGKMAKKNAQTRGVCNQGTLLNLT